MQSSHKVETGSDAPAICIHYGLLFTTADCYKCPVFHRAAKSLLQIPIATLDPAHPDFEQLTKDFNVTTAPTLILCGENAQELFRFHDEQELFAMFMPE